MLLPGTAQACASPIRAPAIRANPFVKTLAKSFTSVPYSRQKELLSFQLPESSLYSYSRFSDKLVITIADRIELWALSYIFVFFLIKILSYIRPVTI